MITKWIHQELIVAERERIVVTDSFAQTKPTRPSEDGGQVAACFSNVG
jgi:hypothetical protein